MSKSTKDAFQSKRPDRKVQLIKATEEGSNVPHGGHCLSPAGHLETGAPKLDDLLRVDFTDPILFSRLTRAFGTADKDSILQLLGQIVATNGEFDWKRPWTWNYLLGHLHGIGPQDPIEGLLAVQMVAVHQTAMDFLNRSMAPGRTPELIGANVNSANKLLRTFTSQMEALDRHRGKITQPVVVGNVNIADGGQAIVGSVNHPGKVTK